MKYLSIIMMFVCSLFIVGCSDDDKIDNTNVKKFKGYYNL